MNKNLIIAHFSTEELNALDLLQGGKSIDKKTGLREYSKLEPLANDPEFRAEFLRNGVLANKNPKQVDKLSEELGLKKPLADDKPPVLKQIALKGRNGDKELALVPSNVIDLFIELKGKPSINKDSGLLEFFDLGTAIAGAALGCVASFFGGKKGSDSAYADAIRDAARIKAETMERLAAQARADAEKAKTDMGYYDKYLVDKRPRRAAINPAYDSYTAKLGAPRYLGEEFFDPRTGKSIDSDRAWDVYSELQKRNAKDIDDPTYEFEPTSDERKEYAHNLHAKARAAQKIYDEFANFGMSSRAGADYSSFLPSEEELLERYPSYDNDMGTTTVKPVRQFAQWILRNKITPRESVKQSESDNRSVSSRSPSLRSQRTAKLSNHSRSNSMAQAKKNLLDQASRRKHTLIPHIGTYREGGLVSHKVSCGIKGKGTGQSDDIKVNMPVGSYIIDATTTAHLGDGSSTAGIKALDNMVKTISKSPVRKLIEKRIQVKKIPVAVANEEYKIDPVTVSVIGSGDLGKGSKLLERMVKRVRQHKAQGGLNLPPQALSPLEYLKV